MTRDIYTRAREAAAQLRATDTAARARRCRALKEVVLRRQEEIIDAIVGATGKVRYDALVSEIFATLDYLHFLERHAPRILADECVRTPLALFGKKSRIYYEPLGVVLVISPWNYPFYLGLVPSLTAFAAGNSVVYKPSEWTPLQGLLESLFSQAGFEPGWIQVVYGDGGVGRALVDGGPDRVVFTGSAATGKKILAAAAEKLIPVTLELGGKDPMIVFADADLDRAAAGALWGAMTNAGQSCTSVERLYVEATVLPAFRDKLVARAKALRQKAERDTGNDLGALTTPFQIEKVAAQVREARAGGAKLHTGEGWDGKDRLAPAMIVDNVPASARLLTEETFGPVLPLIPFLSEAEAIARANDSPYGLSASVWTKDAARADRVARALQVGNVSVNNVMLTEGNPFLPFGGVKASGFGRTKGVAGLREMTNVKSVLFDKDARKFEVNWFPYTREKYRLFSELVNNAFTDGWLALARFILTAIKLESHSQKVSRE